MIAILRNFVIYRNYAQFTVSECNYVTNFKSVAPHRTKSAKHSTKVVDRGSLCPMEPSLWQVCILFSFLIAPMPGKLNISLPRTTGTKRKHDSTSRPSKANYCTLITVAAREAQFLDGPCEARADRFMWCTVCDVVVGLNVLRC